MSDSFAIHSHQVFSQRVSMIYNQISPEELAQINQNLMKTDQRTEHNVTKTEHSYKEMNIQEYCDVPINMVNQEPTLA